MANVDWNYHKELLSLPDLWAEASLLEKLIYKNRSQHRGSLHFKRLLEVQRLARLFNELSCDRLALAMSLGATAARGGTRQRNMPEAVTASKQSLALLLSRLVAGCGVVEALQLAIRKAASQLMAQIAESYFMPFCLAATAALARINALGAAWVVNAAKSYNLLVEALPQLPVAPGWEPPPQAPSEWSTAQADQLPQMLKCDWSNGLVRLRTLSFEGSQSIAEILEPCRAAAVHSGPDVQAQGDAGPEEDPDSVLPVFLDRGPRYSSARLLRMQPSAKAAPATAACTLAWPNSAMSVGSSGASAGPRADIERQSVPIAASAAATEAAATPLAEIGEPVARNESQEQEQIDDPQISRPDSSFTEAGEPPRGDSCAVAEECTSANEAPVSDTTIAKEPPRPLKLTGTGVKLSRKSAKGQMKTAFVRLEKNVVPSKQKAGQSNPLSRSQETRPEAASHDKGDGDDSGGIEHAKATPAETSVPVKKRRLMRQQQQEPRRNIKAKTRAGNSSSKEAPDGAMDDIFASLLQA